MTNNLKESDYNASEVRKMELVLNPSRTKKIKMQFVVYITLISFLLSINSSAFSFSSISYSFF